MENEINEVQVSDYVKIGRGIVLREGLCSEHPEQTYNYIKRVYDVDPCKFGVEKPEPCNNDSFCMFCRTGHGV